MEPLEGSCNCGRNRYIISIPSSTTNTTNASHERAQVIFDNGHHHRRSQATPLSAWLRVPLEWHRSSTYAFHEDETHTSIRRSYTSPREQNAKRHFCGFCGTPLSYWTEEPPEEAAYILLTLGTLKGETLRDLEELGLLPQGAVDEERKDGGEVEGGTEVGDEGEGEEQSGKGTNSAAITQGNQGLPWFDTMVEGSRLGSLKKSMGVRQSRDGNVRVEWEIVEWTASGDENSSNDGNTHTPTSAKRKHDDEKEEEEGRDSKMEGLN